LWSQRPSLFTNFRVFCQTYCCSDPSWVRRHHAVPPAFNDSCCVIARLSTFLEIVDLAMPLLAVTFLDTIFLFFGIEYVGIFLTNVPALPSQMAWMLPGSRLRKRVSRTQTCNGCTNGTGDFDNSP
jgi:hypothetical protein